MALATLQGLPRRTWLVTAGGTVRWWGSAPPAPWPQGQLSFELSPLPPSSALVSPNVEPASQAQPSRHPLGTLPGGWGMADPQTKSCRRWAQPQPPAAGQGSSRAGQGGTGSRGHWLPLLPYLPAKASPAGVKVIRRASGERVRPPSPRLSSPPRLPQPWPGLTDLCFLSPHQPSPPHMALASTAK